MPTPLANSIIDFLLGLEIGSTAQDRGNRFSVEGLTFGTRPDGAFEIGIQKLEAASLRLAFGPVTLESPNAELGPLASANGTIRAKIIDAHLMFDADVTVPIRQGEVDFTDATVEHVGPDSRMGVSPAGIYVDAPNGRSYLYQFPSAPVAGVEYERRNALLGPWVSDRGKLRLQEFAEGQLARAQDGQGAGLTGQTRLLLGRTSLSGDVRLGDGPFAALGARADLVGRAEGRNVVRLKSEAVGRGLTAEMASLSVRNAVLKLGDMQLGCAEMTGALAVRVLVEDTHLRFAANLEDTKISGLRLAWTPAP